MRSLSSSVGLCATVRKRSERLGPHAAHQTLERPGDAGRHRAGRAGASLVSVGCAIISVAAYRYGIRSASEEVVTWPFPCPDGRSEARAPGVRSWPSSICSAAAGRCGSAGSCAATTLSFRELRDACDGMSPSVLNQRLAELRDAGLVELSDDGYRLTADGDELLDLIAPLSRVGEAMGATDGGADR